MFKNFNSLKARFVKYSFPFKTPGGTSRGTLYNKYSWFLIIYEENNPTIIGIGECSILKKLSIDDREDFEDQLQLLCDDINNFFEWLEKELAEFPSIKFGLESALLDLKNGGNRILFPSEFTQGHDNIRINGLIWMGESDFMKLQIDEKIKLGFRCIKMKIGSLDFDKELAMLDYIRSQYDASVLELRVDANGSFRPEEVLQKLEQLAIYDIHSIEQPIAAGNWNQMAAVCLVSPIPVALDEELIGIMEFTEKEELIKTIKPQYLIIKPSLLGGFTASEEWINLAISNNIGWWATSALEANIGLNAIAQWVYTLNNSMSQGLGTGQVFTNNFDSPLTLTSDLLSFNPKGIWKLEELTK